MDDFAAFCPLTLTTDVVGDRWTPLILREMVLGNTRFNDIARALPGLSRSVLTQRLKHLERKGVAETWPSPSGRGNTYHLTPAGKDLEPILYTMGQWSIRWMYDHLDPGEVDAESLMWWMHRRVDPAALPTERVTVQFDHTAPRRCSYWMVFERAAASVCMADPGFPVGAIVTTSTDQLGRVFSGFDTWRSAVRAGRIEVSGRREVVSGLPNWFQWSPWSTDVRDHAAAVRAPSRPSS
ncbi:MAG TPA: helix-turn-helix domain-containing protein [Ilumatobacter sp.]|nr:helix-turn-helix domain-containing protein [Ilumatobacter sp.]